jgi:HAD superfamily hydrolase (TIGR01509 family)
MTGYTLTIFDCDGVLVDSEDAANRVMVEMLAGIGFEIGLADCMARFVGKSMATVQAEVAEETGLAFPPGWTEEIRARTIETLQRERVAAIPGIREVVAAHRAAGRPYCVASSGRVEKMHATLGSAGLMPLFSDVLFSATAVERGKPAPDLFLHVAEVMGHPAERCVVVEDSLPGVQAAVAAGMRVCAYAAAPYVDAAVYRALRAEVFTDMGALPGLLGLDRR